MSQNDGMNLAQYVAIPGKLQTSDADIGGVMSWIAWTLSASGEILSKERQIQKTQGLLLELTL